MKGGGESAKALLVPKNTLN